MLLAIHQPISESVSAFMEALKTGGSTAIIGMAIVFAVLAVIFFALVAMRKLLAPKEKAPEQAPAPVASPAPAPAKPCAPASDDAAVVAAIVAAISAHTGKAPTAFRVVSFKRR